MHHLDTDLPTPEYEAVLTKIIGYPSSLKQKRELHPNRQSLLEDWLPLKLALVGLYPNRGKFSSPLYQVFWSQEAWADVSIDAVNVEFATTAKEPFSESSINSRLSGLHKKCTDPEFHYNEKLGILFIRDCRPIGD